MIELILFAIILQITNIFASPENATILCPDNDLAKNFCDGNVCIDGLSNGEIGFQLCMSCFPEFLRQICPEKVADHYINHIIAEKDNKIHLQKFVDSEEEVIVETK